MGQLLPQTVHPGMRVFAGSDEIGRVIEVGEGYLRVSRGLLMKHEYRIPTKYVAEAEGDVIDLNIGKQQVDGLESTTQDAPAELPDEYRRIEGVDGPYPGRVEDEDVLFRR